MKKTEPGIGKILVDALTTEQIASLLDIVAAAGELNRQADRLEKADPDMAATVSKVLRRDDIAMGEPSLSRISSDQRNIEYWNLLTQWRERHKRRRNLWRDMKSLGLAV